ncbi:MAG: HAD family hydrolase, partial [Proteobacteria bacterium]|nr:HAD family hydrolase [Pseudomonadota bacterium]
TLTEGKPSLISIEAIDSTEDEVLGIAGALQAGSTHPLAHAVSVEVKKRGIRLPSADALRAIPGVGVSGRIDAREYQLGSHRILQQLEVPVPSDRFPAATRSYLVDMESKKVIAILGFEDRVKASAESFVKGLQRQGLKVMILSGDHASVVEAVAKRLGIEDFKGELLPADKSAVIESLKRGGEIVGMLGDGINDTPALAAADVGITFSTGTDVAMQTAGITLMGPDPVRTLDAIRISKKTGSRIRQNLVWAFFYNAVCIPLAASGKLNPMMAGAAMALSSVSVVVSSLLLGWAYRSGSGKE